MVQAGRYPLSLKCRDETSETWSITRSSNVASTGKNSVFWRRERVRAVVKKGGSAVQFVSFIFTGYSRRQNSPLISELCNQLWLWNRIMFRQLAFPNFKNDRKGQTSSRNVRNVDPSRLWLADFSHLKLTFSSPRSVGSVVAQDRSSIKTATSLNSSQRV